MIILMYRSWWLQLKEEVCKISVILLASLTDIYSHFPEASNSVMAIGALGVGAGKALPSVTGAHSGFAAPANAIQSVVMPHTSFARLQPQPAVPHSGLPQVTAPPRLALNIPVPHHISAASRFPSFSSFKPAPFKPGYQEAHQYYCDMREYFASKAYIGISNAELIVVKVRLMTHPPTRKNPICVSVCIVNGFRWE
jgi:hypothetical protein